MGWLKKEKEPEQDQRGRNPPGQYLTEKWPVLHAGSVPRFNPHTWDFRIFGLVETPLRLKYQEFMSLPKAKIISDVHCVTAWSKLDNEWEGVSVRELMKRVMILPEAKFVVTHAEEGFTTNLPIDAFLDDDVLFAYAHNGEPLAPEHGRPLRLVVPKRYFWKSAKWVRGVEFSSEDKPGFWEVRGYNNNADPWKEERYW